MKTDEQLRDDVMAELDWETSVNPTHIGVAARDGVVTLSGHVPSYAQKMAAETAALRVAGVKGVALELDVVLPGSDERTDEDIAKAVNHALHWNTSVPDNRVKVTVEHGIVTLAGTLDWSYQRTAAKLAVSAIVGVRGVIDRFVIAQRVAPRDVRRKIEAALHRQAELRAKDIDIMIDGSQVTLTGKVRAAPERYVVENAVWSAPGVTSVVDFLTVAA